MEWISRKFNSVRNGKKCVSKSLPKLKTLQLYKLTSRHVKKLQFLNVCLECLFYYIPIKLSIYLWYIYHISGMVHISGKQMVPLTIPAKLETFKSTKNIFNWKWCRILEDACSCEHSGIVKLERIAFHTSFNSCTCLPMWTVMPANVDRNACQCGP